MKRDFYLDIYTIFNQMLLTIWTMCTFRMIYHNIFSFLFHFSSRMSESDMSRPNDQLSYHQSGQCIPTLNHRGHQMATSSPLLDDWISSYDDKNPLMDLRCAYGINAYKALDKGIPVIALDTDRRHLQTITENVPPLNMGSRFNINLFK